MQNNNEKIIQIEKPVNHIGGPLKTLAIISLIISGCAFVVFYNDYDNPSSWVSIFVFSASFSFGFISLIASEMINILHDIRRKLYENNGKNVEKK